MAASQYLWHVLAGMYPRSCRASVKVNGAAQRRPEVESASWSCVAGVHIHNIAPMAVGGSGL